jgi:hypothetical protein
MGWLLADKEIAQYLGILSWNTGRKWKRLYGLPIYADPAGSGQKRLSVSLTGGFRCIMASERSMDAKE